MTDDNQQEANQTQPKPNFNGAAIIDENGNEIPITEEMVQNACDSLEDSKS
ncbi:MAG: PA1571 family protein [Porticoccaceae bacterium]